MLKDIICYIDWNIDFRIYNREHSEIFKGWVNDYDGSYNDKGIIYISGGEDERGAFIEVEIETEEM